MSTVAPNTPLPLIDVLDKGRKRGLGALTVERAAKKVSLPLVGVDIQARVVDRVAGVTVKEVFRNPYTEHLEAVYIFPLPGGSAVSDFEMRVGNRVIKGVVKERGEARQQYAKALEEGKRAALLEQERDDVFTVQVGNIPPGEEITVVLTYSERLPFFEDGTTELRLPLVVAPRYIAGNPLDRDQVGLGVELDTDAVPDASRITPPRLVEGFDPKVALGISVELSLAGLADAKNKAGTDTAGLEDLACSQHAVRTGIGGGAIKITLSKDNEPLNRDFVLRWRLSNERVRPTILFYRGEAPAEPATDKSGVGNLAKKGKDLIKSMVKGTPTRPDSPASCCYAMLSMVPPAREGFLGIPRDVVFVVDRSGSMSGIKMSSAARSCSILLSTLGPQDRFAITAFDNVCEWMPGDKSKNGTYFVDADESGIERGNKFLREIDARGGTELHVAVDEAITAIANRQKSEDRAPIIVILTDGEIGHESMVLKQIQTKLGDARVFTVGIDTAVNEGFLKRLASLGGGTCTFVQPGEQLERALSNVGREIGNPLVTDVQIEDINCGIAKDSIAPGRIPDLFEGRASTCFFRFNPGAGEIPKLRVKGRSTDGSTYIETVEAVEVSLPAVAQLWAKAHIADLEDRFRVEPANQATIRKQIVELAIQHSILTRFTAFVVVDESEAVNADGSKRTVVQPVEMPASWEIQADGAWGCIGPAAAGAFGSGAAGAPSYLMSAAAQPAAPSPAQVPQGDTYWGASPASPSGGMFAQSRMKASEGQALASGAGSYGSGTRAQVFEVICKQAMAGANWREVCAGPMQVNNISPEEVEAEVARRQGQLGKPKAKPSDPQAAQARKRLESALSSMAKALDDAASELTAGRMPGSEPIEKARLELVSALVDDTIGTAVPLLQRFLRTEAVELVAALKSKKSTVKSCLNHFERHRRAFEAARLEVEAAMQGSAGGSEAFWEASI